MIEFLLKSVIPVRLDKKTVSQVEKLSKQAKLPFSTMLRVLILEALEARLKPKRIRKKKSRIF